MRRRTKIASVFLGLMLAGFGGFLLALNRAIDSRSGPVYRWPAPAAESFLTDDRAATVAREVMNRDGYPAAIWKLMEDDQTNAPDGRRDRYLSRNADPNQGVVCFYSANTPASVRCVHVELRNEEIAAQGTMGK